MLPRHVLRGGLRLAAAIAAVVAFVVVAHLASPLLPGIAGAVYRQNVAQNIEATALIYTESGDVRDYLDAEHGKYR